MDQVEKRGDNRFGVLDADRLRDILHNYAAPGPPDPNPHKPTCVFLLLFNPAEPHILAIQKTDSDGYPWRNQVALPGGHLEKEDVTPLEGAFRELEEETAIKRDRVDLVGSLGHYQTINGRDIQAFIGVWDGTGSIRYDPTEIARFLQIPLRVLWHTHRGGNFHGRIPAIDELRYPFEDVVIWGATARILHQLIELLYPLFGSISADKSYDVGDNHAAT